MNDLSTARLAPAAALPGTDMLCKLGHELRGPLNGISGLAGVMRMTLAAGPVDPALQLRQLELIRSSADQVVATVDRVVEVARLDTLPVAGGPMDGAAVVADAIGALQKQAVARGVDLVDGTPDRPVPIAGEPAIFGRIVTELVDNAVKYTDSTRVRVCALTAAGGARIEVSDDGPGIAVGEQEKIFAPFVRGDAAHERGVAGCGLGLYLAQRIAARTGARITLHSRPGLGSTFTVHCG